MAYRKYSSRVRNSCDMTHEAMKDANAVLAVGHKKKPPHVQQLQSP